MTKRKKRARQLKMKEKIQFRKHNQKRVKGAKSVAKREVVLS